MRIKLILWLIKSLNSLTVMDRNNILTAVASHLPDYFVIECYDSREGYDKDDGLDEFKVDYPEQPIRMLH